MRKTNIQPRRRSIGYKNKKTNWENVLKISKKTDDSITKLSPDVTDTLASNTAKNYIKDGQFSKSGPRMAFNPIQNNRIKYNKNKP